MIIKTIILNLFICCFIGKISYSQDTTNKLKNSISIEGFYVADYGESELITSYKVKGIMINYSRVLYHKKIHSIKLKFGIGWFMESLGEAEGFLPSLNTNLFVEYLIGEKKHQGSIGLGSDFVPYYYDTYLLIPVGYRFNINKNFSTNITLAQVLWYYFERFDGDDSSISKDWIWNSNLKEIWINIGLSYNF